MTVVLGIDPGVTGAVAWVRDGQLVHFADIPSIGKKVSAPLLADVLGEYHADHACIELLNAMPKMNPTALFKLGQAHGICLGLTHHLPLIPALPRTWKKHFNITGQRKEQKEAARRIAIERWPAFSQAFSRVKDSDRAEAALIALYGYDLTTKEQA